MDLYEDVPYPGFPFPATHPDRLALVATLRGLRPASPEACRVLEIGCADGLNVTAMAAHSPGITAVGFDRAAAPLRRGRDLAATLGLDNVRLHALDVLEAGEELGEFDYVIAHGIYAWAADEIRDAVLRTCKECLAPDGVAFVSYNCFPGARVRGLLREMVFEHTGEVRSHAELVAGARQLYDWMAPWTESRPDGYGQAIHHELNRLRALPDHSLVHDDLGERFEAVWLRDFAAHAAQHGLRFLAEAEEGELRHDRHPPGFDDALDQLAGEDLVRWEQYSDFLSGRAFRQTLLCHQGLHVQAPLDPTAPERLLITLGPAAHAEHIDVRAGNGGGPPGVLERAVEILQQGWPRVVSFEELREASRAAEPGALARALASGFRRGFVDFAATPPRWSPEPGEPPRTSELIRALAAAGPELVSLAHERVRLEDEVGRFMLVQMDGTHDREALLEAVVQRAGVAPEQVAAGLEHNLRALASLKLVL